MDTPVRRVALVVEDHALTRTLLADALQHAGFDVVCLPDAHTALTEFDAIDPDVLIADVDLGSPPNGIELAVALTERAAYLGVVILTNYSSAAQAPGGAALPDGTVFLRKIDLGSTDVLLDAVEATMRRQPPRRADVETEAAGPLSNLTQRQLLLLRRMAEGWSNAQIAEQHGVTVAALEKMTTRMFTALGLHDDPRRNSRVVAVRMYIETFGPPPPAPAPPATTP